MTASTSSQRLDALTGLRFIAALHVVLFHYGAALFATAPPWAEQIRASGFAAVSFFFVLSGFILTFHYGAQLERGVVDRKSFWVQRVARIYPAYALGLLLLVPFSLFADWARPVSLFVGISDVKKLATGSVSALMLQSWAPQTAASWNVPGWSISVEMFFYLLFPCVGRLVVRRLSTAGVWGLAVIAFLVGLIPPLLYLGLNPDHLPAVTRESAGFWLTLLKFCPLARLPEFLMGVAVGALFLRRRPTRSRASLVVAPLTLVAIAVALGHSPSLPYVLLHNGALAPLYAMAIWGLAVNDGPISRLLALRPLRMLGEASYSLYILQLPVMAYWLLIATGLGLAPRSAAGTVAYLITIVAVSLISHLAVERTAHGWLKQRLLAALARGRSRAVDSLPQVAP